MHGPDDLALLQRYQAKWVHNVMVALRCGFPRGQTLMFRWMADGRWLWFGGQGRNSTIEDEQEDRDVDRNFAIILFIMF